MQRFSTLVVVVAALAVIVSSASPATAHRMTLRRGRGRGRLGEVRAAVADLLALDGHDASTVFDNLPVNGSVWPVGGFETEIFVGTPAQPQLVQIDTGSSDLLVAQAGCKACPKPKYDPASSSTARFVRCNSTAFVCKGCATDMNLCSYNNTYQTCNYANPEAACSLLGTTFYDVASLGPHSGVAATVGFGGIQAHGGAFDNEWTNMPGVMGMGYPHLAGVWADNTVFNSWVKAGELKPVFGMCLVGDGGLITLGDVDATLFTGALQYTPVVQQAWYVLHMLDLSVDGTSVGLPSSSYNKIGGSSGTPGTILDSGTNTFVISGEAYTIVQARFQELCKTTSLRGVCNVPATQTLFKGGCYAMTPEDIAQFPEVAVTLQGTGQLAINGQQYLIPHPEKQGHFCMGIQSSGMGGFTILGNVFQSGFYVVFDQGNTRLGFAPVNTATCKE